MRWQYKAGAALAVAALAWAGVRLLSAGGAPAAAPPAQTAAAVPAGPLASGFSTDPAAPARSASPPRPLPPRVTRFIADEYAQSAATREALTQIAYGWSQAVNDVRDPADAKQAGDAIAKGIACALNAGVLNKAGVDQQVMLDRIRSTRAIMLDTEADTLSYIRFQSLAGGQYFDDPGPGACSFDPASLPN
ncbi:hypothetical protein [Burkholderia alba]|uniref:hypothetical protein n=1 Tax=Burkholderia alba TaxID=2683677 RepID=UPI002B05279D|nr:hypothetical protein [Burkholderia alba]